MLLQVALDDVVRLKLVETRAAPGTINQASANQTIARRIAGNHKSTPGQDEVPPSQYLPLHGASLQAYAPLWTTEGGQTSIIK